METEKENIWKAEKQRILAIYSKMLQHALPYEIEETRKLLTIELETTKKEIEVHDKSKGRYINPRI